MAQKFNFLEVNCSNKSICDKFEVNKYPTIKVYINGSYIDEEPNRELENVLEFLDKVQDEPIKYLDSKTDGKIKDFRTNYGEVNFILAINNAKDTNEKIDKDNDNNTSNKNELINCIRNLAKEKYLSQYYFGIVNKESYQNYRKGKKQEIQNPNNFDMLTVRKN